MSTAQPRKIIHMISKRDDGRIITLCGLTGRHTRDREYTSSVLGKFTAVLPSDTHIGATCQTCRARMYARRQNNERSLVPVR